MSTTSRETLLCFQQRADDPTNDGSAQTLCLLQRSHCSVGLQHRRLVSSFYGSASLSDCLIPKSKLIAFFYGALLSRLFLQALLLSFSPYDMNHYTHISTFAQYIMSSNVMYFSAIKSLIQINKEKGASTTFTRHLEWKRSGRSVQSDWFCFWNSGPVSTQQNIGATQPILRGKEMENANKISINPVKGQAVTRMLHAITLSQIPLIVPENWKACFPQGVSWSWFRPCWLRQDKPTFHTSPEDYVAKEASCWSADGLMAVEQRGRRWPHREV